MKNVTHILSRQLTDFDHAVLAYFLGVDKVPGAVLERLTILNKQDEKGMNLYMEKFNVTSLKALAREAIRYYEHHPEKIDRFKGASAHDPKTKARDFGKGIG